MIDGRFQFELEATDGEARAGTIRTRRGTIHTPIFMPVGTQGTVKGLSPEEVEDVGAEIVLGNTYHLYLRPGTQVIEELGGLHEMMGWSGPILTDSGGYQFFSLNDLCTFDDDGVTFRSHLDGSEHRFEPETVIEIQRVLGSDIMMVLDECPALPASRAVLERSVRRSTAWALRCLEARRDGDGALFAIGQGGTDVELRVAHIEELAAHPFDGLAIGGLAVGEETQRTYDTIEAVAPRMPSARPRYLMGVGKPEDIVASIERGVDMFDCVMPTRNARRGQVFTREGAMHIKNARFRHDRGPIDEACACYACRRYTRAYIHHLFRAKELLGLRLMTVHNLQYYLDLVRGARAATLEGRFAEWARDCRAGWAA